MSDAHEDTTLRSAREFRDACDREELWGTSNTVETIGLEMGQTHSALIQLSALLDRLSKRPRDQEVALAVAKSLAAVEPKIESILAWTQTFRKQVAAIDIDARVLGKVTP